MNNDKKYKYTKQLLKIAKQEGNYTNKDIEKKAGLKGSSSSLASRWLNGKALATERQMRYFINNYGHLLKRKMEHLYSSFVPKDEKLVIRYHKICGDIIFKHQIRKERKFSRHSKWLGILRIIVIQDERCFQLLLQYRADIVVWKKDVDSRSYSPHLNIDNTVNSDIEEANWYLFDCFNCENTDKLIEHFNLFSQKLLNADNIIELAAKNAGGYSRPIFTINDVAPLKFAFYQKLMKLGLQSELLPF